MTEDDGHRYVLASFVGKRDGMALELHDADHRCIAEVFEDDATGACCLSIADGAAVPIDRVCDLLARAAAEFPQVAASWPIAPQDRAGP